MIEQMTEFLVCVPGIDLKAANLSGMTATDILMQRRITDARDLDIEESLKRAHPITTPFHLNRPHNLDRHFSGNNTPNKKKKKKKKTKNEGDWVDRKRSALMVVASLIATMAFQFAVTPPQYMWTNTDDSSPDNVRDAIHYVRKAADHLKGEAFYTINTTTFIASLSIILLLMSGLPLNSRVVVWTLMMTTWIAISGIALSYTVAVISQSTPPPSKEKSVYFLVAITVFVWICLVTLLLLGHTVRLFVKTVKILMRSLSVRRRQYPASPTRV